MCGTLNVLPFWFNPAPEAPRTPNFAQFGDLMCIFLKASDLEREYAQKNQMHRTEFPDKTGSTSLMTVGVALSLRLEAHARLTVCLPLSTDKTSCCNTFEPRQSALTSFDHVILSRMF